MSVPASDKLLASRPFQTSLKLSKVVDEKSCQALAPCLVAALPS
jgi:hypothetical protein